MLIASNQVYRAQSKLSSFRETKHPSSKTAQIQSQTNHFEEVSIHYSSLICPQSFSFSWAGFQLLSSSLTPLPSFWGNLSLHFPATFIYCPPGVQGKPISLSIPNGWVQAKPCFSHCPSSMNYVQQRPAGLSCSPATVLGLIFPANTNTEFT